ncbi:unnamed protein product [Phyllotreta striolata]|uniref:Uncharacterized protein n=1 Tax=Phyllotreta striolata TaxID=444603 RepID=A0A9N9XMV0_PHYSR|nr:unnamed protein product [Phyllotreta striolata]
MKFHAALCLTVLLCHTVCGDPFHRHRHSKRDSNYQELERYFNSLVEREQHPALAASQNQADISDLEDLLERYGVDANEDEESVKQYDQDFLDRYTSDLEADEQNDKKIVYNTRLSYAMPLVRPQGGNNGRVKGGVWREENHQPGRYHANQARRNFRDFRPWGREGENFRY